MTLISEIRSCREGKSLAVRAFSAFLQSLGRAIQSTDYLQIVYKIIYHSDLLCDKIEKVNWNNLHN